MPMDLRIGVELQRGDCGWHILRGLHGGDWYLNPRGPSIRRSSPRSASGYLDRGYCFT